MTKQTSPLPPALDETAIRQLERDLRGGNLGPVLQTFATELENRRAKLVQIHARADHSELLALAHGVKGSAATFCAPALAQAARELEDKLVERDLDAIDGATQRLSAEIVRAIEHVRQMTAGRGSERG